MSFRYLMFAGLLLLLFSCRPKEIALPLASEDLVGLLADIHLAEAGFRELPISLQDSLAPLYYDRVLTSHGVSKVDFDSTMFILREDPKRLEALYVKVMEELSIRETAAQNKRGKGTKDEEEEEIPEEKSDSDKK